MKAFEQVVEFNKKVLGIEQRPLTFPSGSELDHSVKCLKEEATELSEAYQAGDFIGCIDANIDTMYFAIGNLYKLGLTPEQMEKCFTVVHEHNMRKVRGVVDRRGDGSAPDAIKPEGFVGPEEQIAEILDQLPEVVFRSGIDENARAESASPEVVANQVQETADTKSE